MYKYLRVCLGCCSVCVCFSVSLFLFLFFFSSFSVPYCQGGDTWYVDGAPWKPQLDAFGLFYFWVVMM
jgi:hypothetical protein